MISSLMNWSTEKTDKQTNHILNEKNNTYPRRPRQNLQIRLTEPVLYKTVLTRGTIWHSSSTSMISWIHFSYNLFGKQPREVHTIIYLQLNNQDYAFYQKFRMENTPLPFHIFLITKLTSWLRIQIMWCVSYEKFVRVANLKKLLYS